MGTPPVMPPSHWMRPTTRPFGRHAAMWLFHFHLYFMPRELHNMWYNMSCTIHQPCRDKCLVSVLCIGFYTHWLLLLKWMPVVGIYRGLRGIYMYHFTLTLITVCVFCYVISLALCSKYDVLSHYFIFVLRILQITSGRTFSI